MIVLRIILGAVVAWVFVDVVMTFANAIKDKREDCDNGK